MEMIRHLTRGAISAVLVFGMVACGGGDGDNNSNTNGSGDNGGGSNNGDGTVNGGDGDNGSGTISGNISQWGTISVDQSDGEVELGAGFFSISNATIPSVDLLAALQPTADTCEVSINEFTDPTDIPDFDIDISIDTVDAGIVTFTAPAGTYATLMPTTQFGFTIYQLEDGVALSSPAPTDMTVSAAGNGYPGFTESVPNVTPISNVNPGRGASLSASTTITWDAGSDPNSTVTLGWFGFDGQSSISVDCYAADDGSFTVPAATLAEIADTSILTLSEVAREAYSIHQYGNSILIIDNYSGI